MQNGKPFHLSPYWVKFYFFAVKPGLKIDWRRFAMETISQYLQYRKQIPKGCFQFTPGLRSIAGKDIKW